MQAQGRQAQGRQGQKMQARYAPGARVVIRDCEWIVRRADPSDDGGYVLTVDGLSELVSGKSARFLSRLEEQADAIRVLDPAETRFEQDLTPGFEKSRLFIENQRRQITPADERIHLGHQAAMDPVPYQLDPALQALSQNPIESPERTDSSQNYGIALGWEDIKEMQEGIVRKTYEDDTLPDGPWEITVAYQAPFFRPDREEGYRVAWAVFEKESA